MQCTHNTNLSYTLNNSEHCTLYNVHNNSLLSVALSGINIVNNDKKNCSRPLKTLCTHYLIT